MTRHFQCYQRVLSDIRRHGTGGEVHAKETAKCMSPCALNVYQVSSALAMMCGKKVANFFS